MTDFEMAFSQIHRASAGNWRFCQNRQRRVGGKEPISTLCQLGRQAGDLVPKHGSDHERGFQLLGRLLLMNSLRRSKSPKTDRMMRQLVLLEPNPDGW